MDQNDIFENNEIKKTYTNIFEWKNAEPSVVSQLIGRATAPISWLVRKMIPASAIHGALTGFDWVVKNTTTEAGASDSNDIVRCNKSADQVINFHIGVAMAEGGAAGLFGLPAMVVDVPTAKPSPPTVY